MKLLSTFIKKLEELKEQYGDLPVVTANLDGQQDTIPDDDAVCDFWKNGAWDSDNQKMCDCVLIR